ncbi:MAG: maleylpyruvate isomerase family mycothiol-dependent enzyme, partial [Haloechinothrix sp.]
LDGLVAAIETAPPDVECWSFLPAPSPLTFWARRQTHETTMHRVDAETAAGAVSPVDPAVATDGIDELLTGFVVRRKGRLRSAEPRTLAVHTTDTDAHWMLTVSDQPVVTDRADATADAVLRGPAHDLYLALWNRLPLGELEVSGDQRLIDQWPTAVRIRWT